VVAAENDLRSPRAEHGSWGGQQRRMNAGRMRKRLKLEASLYQILQILSLAPCGKPPILRALQAIDQDANFAENVNQLILLDF
jgi:hypothetical protein